MAEYSGGNADTLDAGRGGFAWRKRIAVLAAVALAAGGLLLLERSPASATSSPSVVHAATHQAATVTDRATHLSTVSSKLLGAASLMTHTAPALDSVSAARAVDAAASATNAATLSSQVAADAAARSASVVSRANALKAALGVTQAKAAAVAPVSSAIFGITFCTFRIVIGPFIIDVPGIIHIVIGPIIIVFRAPCFLSGLIPFT